MRIRISGDRAGTVRTFLNVAAASVLLFGCALEAQDDEVLVTVNQALDANVTYTFRNAHAGKCLDVTNVSSENGANIQLWECTGQAAQQFTLVPYEEGYYSLKMYRAKSASMSGPARPKLGPTSPNTLVLEAPTSNFALKMWVVAICASLRATAIWRSTVGTGVPPTALTWPSGT